MLENEPHGSGSGLEPASDPGDQSPPSATPAPRRRRAASRPAGAPSAAEQAAASAAQADQSAPAEPAHGDHAESGDHTESSPPADQAEGGPAPAKKARAARKGAAKTTAARTRTRPAAAAPAEDEPEAPAAAPEQSPAPEAPAETTVRRTRRRASAAPAEPTPEPDGPSAAAEPTAQPAAEPEPAAEEGATARRRTRKRATAPQSAPESVSEPVTAESGTAAEPVTAKPVAAEAVQPEPARPEPVQSEDEQVAEPAKAGRTRTRRRATTPVFGTGPVVAAVPEPVEPHDEDEEADEESVRSAAGSAQPPRPGMLIFQAPVVPEPAHRRRATAPQSAPQTHQEPEPAEHEEAEPAAAAAGAEQPAGGKRRRRARGGEPAPVGAAEVSEHAPAQTPAPSDDDGGSEGSNRRRRRRRRRQTAEDLVDLGAATGDDPPNTVVKIREPRDRRSGRSERGEPDSVRTGDDVLGVRGSVRLAAKQQRRRDGRSSRSRRAPIVTEAEFLARRESVERVMVVRESAGRTQIGVLEDGVLVEHYVNKESSVSYVGNVYLGKVQNVLPSMEAAFVDIGKGRNAVLYAGEVNFEAAGLSAGAPKRIESALRSGQPVLVQVTKDPIGHKGARLTSQISLPGRFLVYIPGGSMMGISRKLPENERTRLKQILKKVVPEDGGVIVRTAAEGASEEELAQDVERLVAQWEEIERRSHSANAPALLHGEPDLSVRVIRDIFNEDFTKLVISGEEAYKEIHEYLAGVAPELAERVEHWTSDTDVFSVHRVDEQLAKGLDRKVWLPSGGSLVIDRTEAMVVVDVNTGKFTGQGSSSLEETVTRNNLEAAEEIVRQLRLRDLGGIVVIDFIDMVLESNRDLVLRRLLECLGRDRTKHQVAEVTSLGLVQMTRKRVGQGLLEAFSETCEHCNGRGVIVHMDPVEAQGRKKEPRHTHAEPAPAAVRQPAEQDQPWRGESGAADTAEGRAGRRRRRKGKHHDGDGFFAGDGEGFDQAAEPGDTPAQHPAAAVAAAEAAPVSAPVSSPAAAPVALKAHQDDPDALGEAPEPGGETARPRKRRRAASRPAGSPGAEG
jgi:ribonuclease E